MASRLVLRIVLAGLLSVLPREDAGVIEALGLVHLRYLFADLGGIGGEDGLLVLVHIAHGRAFVLLGRLDAVGSELQEGLSYLKVEDGLVEALPILPGPSFSRPEVREEGCVQRLEPGQEKGLLEVLERAVEHEVLGMCGEVRRHEDRGLAVPPLRIVVAAVIGVEGEHVVGHKLGPIPAEVVFALAHRLEGEPVPLQPGGDLRGQLVVAHHGVEGVAFPSRLVQPGRDPVGLVGVVQPVEVRAEDDALFPLVGCAIEPVPIILKLEHPVALLVVGIG